MPKMGHGTAFDLKGFQKLYAADPFYAWFGLDHPLMYAAHKAAGGMTSIYRQIGIGCESLIRQIIQDRFAISEENAKWSYTVPRSGNRTRKLSLDARIPLDALAGARRRQRVKSWMRRAARSLDLDADIAQSLKGCVFEIRQGYKSKDSKRQNADIANAATAYTQAYLPVVMILSTQIDDDIQNRYRMEKWLVLTGELSPSPIMSTYAFMKKVVAYDLAAFFDRNSGLFQAEILMVLEHLLSASEQ